MKIADSETKQWIRNRSDELAVNAGCRFDPERAAHAIDWMEGLRLYQGEYAGCPFESRDWQFEFHSRLYGWVFWSDFWNKWVRRFREASVWIAKKNKKSPTLAANALYGLAGDGESGQECYLCARDGQQARKIAGRHAIEMVRQSDWLNDRCKININESSITWIPDDPDVKGPCTLAPLSSSNSRNIEAKEGINGSIYVDETHVVTREFMGRITRSGISRVEPLHLEFSTAGDNPDGYGRSRVEYGRQVESGAIHNLRFLHLEYAAPEKVKDRELLADPLKFAKMANPALGHTVDPEELLNDVEQSRDIPSEWRRCKQYRFNLWQSVSSPWLSQAHWEACYSDRPISDFKDQPCWVGVDLSLTNDLTAVVVCFLEQAGAWLFPFFWMPQETAEERRDDADFLGWAERGHLMLTPGNVVRQRDAEDFLVEFENRIAGVNYDKTFCEKLRQDVTERRFMQWADFPQNSATFAEPIEDFEHMVLAGTVHHPGNEVLSWMSRNCKFTEDNKGRKMLTKPKKQSVKKIDGIVASVMALAAAKADRMGGRSIYSTPGSMAL